MKYFQYLFVFLLSLLLNVFSSYAQYYEYLNISDSDMDSKEAVVNFDSSDNFQIFWIEDRKEIYYRYSEGNIWSDKIPVYQSSSGNSISVLTSEVINDTSFVFFHNDEGDSTHLIYCCLYNSELIRTDTIQTLMGTIKRFRSAKNNNEIALAYSNFTSSQTIYVTKYPQLKSWAVSDSIYYLAQENFSIAYDGGDSLWVFCIWDNVWSRYLMPSGTTWSDKVYGILSDGPDDLDCKYNPVSGNFNMLISSAKASCTDCIENRILYSEGYNTNWSECEDVDLGNSGIIYQGRFDYPFLEITSSGVRNGFYKYDYWDDMSDDEYSIRLAQKVDASSGWDKNPVLQFSDNQFVLTSTAINSQDSLYFTYSRNGNVYLAAEENTSALDENKSSAGFTKFKLFPAYPNPFNPITTIRFQLSATAVIKIAVYNLTGKQVAVLFNGKQQAGSHSILWNANDLASGIYYCRMLSNSGYVQTQKIVLIR